MKSVHVSRVVRALNSLTLHDGDSGVGGAQIDTDDGALDLLLAALSVSSYKLGAHWGPDGGGAPCC
jgi:hypothetical protein